jgi:hypothetical protein
MHRSGDAVQRFVRLVDPGGRVSGGVDPARKKAPGESRGP